MARIKYWQYIVDEEGRPIQSANVNFYLAGTDTFAQFYVNDTTGTQTDSDETTLQTDANGFMNLYLGDEWELSGGYAATQKFKITWSKAGIRLGEIDNIDVYPSIFQVDETDNTSLTTSVKNKLVSNTLAKQWEDHRTASYSTAPHDLQPVNVNGSSTTFNRLVNNSLMNYLYSLVASAGGISIAASAAIFRPFTVNTWTASAGEFYTNISHFLNRDYPILQLTEASTEEKIEPANVISLGANDLQVWIGEDINVEVSIVG